MEAWGKISELFLWILERLEKMFVFAIQLFKAKPNWKFTEGINFVFRERRPPIENEPFEIEKLHAVRTDV